MSSSVIRTLGSADGSVGLTTGSRQALRLSNNNTLYVVIDKNTSGTGGQGDGTGVQKVHIYERDGVTNVVTLRASIATAATADLVSAALFSNNDLAIVVRDTPSLTRLRYCKMTYATYAASAWETAHDTVGITAQVGFFDVNVSDGGAVYVTENIAKATGLFTGLSVRTTGAAWVYTQIAQEHNNVNIRWDLTSTSVCPLNNSGTTRRLLVGATGGYNDIDSGMNLYTCNVVESSGAVSSIVLRDTNPNTGNSTSRPPSASGSRIIQLFRSNTDEWSAGAISSIGHQTMSISRGTWDGATFAFILPWTAAALGIGGEGSGGGFNLPDAPISLGTYISPAISYGNNAMNFMVITIWGQSSKVVVNYIMRYTNGLYGQVYGTPSEGKMNQLVAGATAVAGGGNRNFSSETAGDALVQYGTSPGATMQAIWQKVPNPGGISAILSLSPADGTVAPSATPVLTGVIDTNLVREWSRYWVEYQFAENSIYTLGLIDQLYTGATPISVKGTDQAGVTKAFNDVLSATTPLHAGVWFYRARLVNEAGQVGTWTTSNSVTVGHPPVMVPLSPGGARYYPFNGGAIDYSWNFTDPSSTDFQTAYQVVVTNTETLVTVLDTGKLISPNHFHQSIGMSATHKDKRLSWVGRLWDSDDVPGNYSDGVNFYVTDPPVVTITAPTSGSTVANSRPTITYNVTAGGGRTIREATLTIYKAGLPVWVRRVVLGVASGVSLNEKVDAGLLTDATSYTVQVKAIDSSGVEGISSLIPFTVDWVAPAAPTGVAVSVTNYNVEGAGYVSVTWDSLANDANFSYFTVYRRDDQINPLTGAVVETGVLKLVWVTYESSTTNTFKDYFAPAGYKVNYVVRQVASTGGADYESTNTTVTTVQTTSDGYWLIKPDATRQNNETFKMSITTGDSFTNEKEETEFLVIGKGRVFNKGEEPGVRGTLDVQLRDTGIYTARQKKRKIDSMISNATDMYLRNPFGDTYKVNISAISLSRIAGVGGSEFCDASIPYAEVGA